ncbi:MAG: 6-phosphogluconolactonase, partial [Actinomycetales bacterium]
DVEPGDRTVIFEPGLALQEAGVLVRSLVQAPGAVRAGDGVNPIGIDRYQVQQGHVASIFPESPARHERQRYVVAVTGCPKPPPMRVTMTFPAINAARQVWILASGNAKARAVRLMLEPGAGPLQVPAAGVRGHDLTLVLVDQAAASLLPPEFGRPEA